MAWLFLLLSGVFELVGVVGFQRLTRRDYAAGLPLTVFGFGAGLILLHAAMASLPLAVAYGVFTGIGTLGSAAIGIVFWGESAAPPRLFFIAVIVASVIGIKITL